MTLNRHSRSKSLGFLGFWRRQKVDNSEAHVVIAFRNMHKSKPEIFVPKF